MTDMNSDMTREELQSLQQKKNNVIANLRRKWQAGELTEGQIAQLESLGVSKHTRSEVVVGVNDLATVRPEIAAEWHPVKNERLTPQDVTFYSSRYVWWRHFHEESGVWHEWITMVRNRSNGSGCPYCSGVRALAGFNDLASQNPQKASDWDYEKNAPLTPRDVTCNSGKKAWWKCHVCGYEWKGTIRSTSCKVCRAACARKPVVGVDDLATVAPEVALDWHYERNAPLTPADVKGGCGDKVWWKCHVCGGEWQAMVGQRTTKSRPKGCPYCSGAKVLPGVNDFATRFPEKAECWDYGKNAPLTPSQVTAGSTRRVWWKCPDCSCEWQKKVCDYANRVSRCRECASSARISSNNLAQANPQLAAEWHPEKNGDLTPQQVTTGSHKKAWWCCNIGHEWEAPVYSRNQGHGCPICARDTRKKKRGLPEEDPAKSAGADVG